MASASIRCAAHALDDATDTSLGNPGGDALPVSSTAEHYMAMSVRPVLQKGWTIQEVRALRDQPNDGARYELVDGELLVTPSPTGLHQMAVQLLWSALYPYVKTQRVGLAALAPRDVDLEPEATTQPDVFVVPPEEIERFLGSSAVQQLLLAAEVLSPGSARGDRVRKRSYFQRNAVSEYWIVDLEARVVERWHPEDERPQVIVDTVEWSPAGTSAPFVLELAPYFAEVFREDS